MGGVANCHAAFDARDVVSTSDSFNESYIYYRSSNPRTGQRQPRVGRLKRVVAQGVPVLVGSHFYVPPD